MEDIVHDPKDVQRTSSKVALAIAIVAVSGFFLYLVGSGVAKLAANGFG